MGPMTRPTMDSKSSDSAGLAPSLHRAEPQLSESEFELFSSLVASHTGIALGAHRRALLEARLGKRLVALGLSTFVDYYRVLKEQDPNGEELARFVNAVTTNKTEFFREPHHFAYLRERLAPALEGRADRSLRVWSAGCSSGEEPYTIAITLLESLRDPAGWDLRILASDIDTEMLDRAKAGVYRLDDLGGLPRAALRRHFLRGVGENEGLVRVKASVRDLVVFRRINLLEATWPIRTSFDVVFCRNVIIYFDPSTQAQVLERLVGYVKDEGLLVLGHTEGVHGVVAGLHQAGLTIYRKEGPPCPPPS
jgi:chemotaxis protein methyltransferase CheR